MGCVVLEPCRLRFRAEATSALLLAGAGAGDARAALNGPNDQQLRLVLGGLVAFPATGEPADVAMAAWALDKATKNFLTACWRRRAHFVGHLSVRQGKLVQESALDARDPALAPATPARTADQLEACISGIYRHKLAYGVSKEYFVPAPRASSARSGRGAAQDDERKTTSSAWQVSFVPVPYACLVSLLQKCLIRPCEMHSE